MLILWLRDIYQFNMYHVKITERFSFVNLQADLWFLWEQPFNYT